LRQAFVEAKNFIKSSPEITVWAGQRFYDRHDIHMHDLFFDDYSGYGMGFDNIDLGFGKLAIAYLGGYRDGLDNGNTTVPETTILDTRRGGFYLHTIDVRIHDINLLGGQLELLGDYQFFKGGVYTADVDRDGDAAADRINIGDTSGFRVGAIYYHPICPTAGASYFNTSFWQISAAYGYGAGELFGTDPNGGRHPCRVHPQ
jgi:maltoporin